MQAEKSDVLKKKIKEKNSRVKKLRYMTPECDKILFEIENMSNF